MQSRRFVFIMRRLCNVWPGAWRPDLWQYEMSAIAPTETLKRKYLLC
jgi:hypothetical protein